MAPSNPPLNDCQNFCSEMAKCTRPPPAALFSAILTTLLTCMHPMHAVATANPAVDAVTRGSAAAAAETDALRVSPTRNLLHGRRPPQNWSRCNLCTTVTCTGSRCSGHCRANGMVHRCSSPRTGVTAGADAVLLTFAEAPYIGCSNLDRGVSGCELTPAQIAPRAGYTVDAPNGAVSARCIPEPPSLRSRTYGACLCEFTSTDGNSQMSAFCEASAGLAAELPTFEFYLESVYEDTGLLLDYGEEEVEYGGETVTVTLVAPLEHQEYEDEGDVEDDADYVYDPDYLYELS